MTIGPIKYKNQFRTQVMLPRTKKRQIKKEEYSNIKGFKY